MNKTFMFYVFYCTNLDSNLNSELSAIGQAEVNVFCPRQGSILFLLILSLSGPEWIMTV